MALYDRYGSLFSTSHLYSVYDGFGTINRGPLSGTPYNNDINFVFFRNFDNSITMFRGNFIFSTSSATGALTGGTVTEIVHLADNDRGYSERWNFINVPVMNLQNLSGSQLTAFLMDGPGDTIQGGNFDDELHGGNGGSDVYWLGQSAGLDHVYLGDPVLTGNYVLDYSASQHALTIDLVSGRVHYSGTAAFGDVLHDSNANNVDVKIWSDLDLDDTVIHNGNRGIISTGNGDDLIRGNGGGDQIDGAQGTDTVDYSWVGSNVLVTGLFSRGVGGGPLLITLGGTAFGGSATYEHYYDPPGGLIDDELWVRTQDQLDSIENVIGSNGADLIDGNSLGNLVKGLGGSDLFKGYGGNDTFEGGSGRDTLDYSWIGFANPAFVTELSVVLGLGAGIGTATHATLSGIDTFSAVEVLIGSAGNDYFDARKASGTLQIEGGAGNDTIVDSVYSHVLKGGLGNDKITASGGDDTVEGGDGTNQLYGGDGNDRMTGGGGIDLLDGGLGNDTLIGGLQNDTYVVNGQGDVIIEANIAADTADRLRASGDYALGSSAYVEILETVNRLDSAPIDLAGNAIANIIRGNAGLNTLSGGGGNDRLDGYEADDFLDGGSGADTLVGGIGNDAYIVDNAGDVILETSGQGTADLVRATSSYAVAEGADIERIEAFNLAGTAALNLAGNSLANRITGNAGANTLDGGGGNDTLTGGAGNDKFLFDDALGGTNRDTISDFSVPQDTINLDNAVFTTLAAGALLQAQFFTGTAAHDADDRIIYNSVTGVLLYDADGNTAGAAVQFAKLTPGLVMTFADFFVV